MNESQSKIKEAEAVLIQVIVSRYESLIVRNECLPAETIIGVVQQFQPAYNFTQVEWVEVVGKLMKRFVTDLSK